MKTDIIHIQYITGGSILAIAITMFYEKTEEEEFQNVHFKKGLPPGMEK